MATPTADSYSVASGATVVAGRSGLPSWMRDEPLLKYISIPNTALSSVPPSPVPPGISGPSSKVNAWNGIWVRNEGSFIGVGPCGGHDDYYGNEINVIQLNTDVPAWVERKASTPAAQMYKSVVAYADLRRSSGHVYYGFQYDQINDRLLMVTTSGPFGSGTSVPDAPGGWPWVGSAGTFMAYDWQANEWLAPDALAPFPMGATGLPGHQCCVNSATGEVFYTKMQDGTMRKYNPATNAHSTVGSWYLDPAQRGSAIDPVRGNMLICGDTTGTYDPQVRSINNAAQQSVTFGGLGKDVLKGTGYPGVEFDPDNDCFWVMFNTNPITLYKVNAADWVVSQPTTTGTTPAQRTNGIHNSFRYVPELRGLAFVNDYFGNVKFIRTAP